MHKGTEARRAGCGTGGCQRVRGLQERGIRQCWLGPCGGWLFLNRGQSLNIPSSIIYLWDGAFLRYNAAVDETYPFNFFSFSIFTFLPHFSFRPSACCTRAYSLSPRTHWLTYLARTRAPWDATCRPVFPPLCVLSPLHPFGMCTNGTSWRMPCLGLLNEVRLLRHMSSSSMILSFPLPTSFGNDTFIYQLVVNIYFLP